MKTNNDDDDDDDDDRAPTIPLLHSGPHLSGAMRRNRIFVIFVVCHHERHLGTLHKARTSTLRCAEFQSSQPPGVGAAEPDPQKVSFCSVLCFSCTKSVLLGCLVVCSCSV